MYSKTLIVALSGLALANAAPQTQPAGPPNATVQGSPVYDGPPALVTGELGDAPVTMNNPAGVTYQAVLPNVATTDIRGSISGTSGPGGRGVQFTVNFTGFPSLAEGPFGRPSVDLGWRWRELMCIAAVYHIHELPVPADGNCTGTGPHLDPTIRLEQPACLAAQPQTCQVGDLAGKHGNVTASPFQTRYVARNLISIPIVQSQTRTVF